MGVAWRDRSFPDGRQSASLGASPPHPPAWMPQRHPDGFRPRPARGWADRRLPKKRRSSLSLAFPEAAPIAGGQAPQTVIGRSPASSSRRYNFSSHDLASLRSKITKWPSEAAQRSM